MHFESLSNLSNPMKVFKINDYDYYMANSLEEAIQAAMTDSGLSWKEVTDGGAYNISEAGLDKLIFTDDDGTKRTFREELEQRIAAGTTKAELFASEAM